MADHPKGPRKNHVVSWRKIREFIEAHPEDPSVYRSFAVWYDVVEKIPFGDFHAVKRVFGKASLVDGLVVFNIGGNKYRLVAEMFFGRGRIHIRHVLTHKDYDKGDWKK